MARKKTAPPQASDKSDADRVKLAQDLLEAALQELLARTQGWNRYGIKVEDAPSGKTLLSQDRQTQAMLAGIALHRLGELDGKKAVIAKAIQAGIKAQQISLPSIPTNWQTLRQQEQENLETMMVALQARINRSIASPAQEIENALDQVVEEAYFVTEILRSLLRRNLPLREADIISLLNGPLIWFGAVGAYEYYHSILESGIAKAVENWAAANPIRAPMRSAMERFIERLGKQHFWKPSRRCADRLQTLLTGTVHVDLQPGEAWSDAAVADLEGMQRPQRDAWMALLFHCQNGGTGRLTSRWQKEVEPLIEAVGFKNLKERLLCWFPRVDRPRTQPYRRQGGQANQEHLLLPPHVELLRGLAWSCGLHEDAELARALMRLAISSYRKLPGVGPRLVSLGNACVAALGLMPGLTAIGQLAILKVKVKFGSAQREIDKAFTTAAAREGLPAEEIEELAVPAYGLEQVGRLHSTLGDCCAELSVDGTAARLSWLKGDKRIKSAPAAVKQDHPEELKGLQTAVKDINAMLPAQRERLDTLFLARRAWPFALWRERYLDHLLIGTIARRLIWSFTHKGRTRTGFWADDALVDLDDRRLELGTTTMVALWHPIGRPVEEVLAWRDWLERREVVQPFKQAHREVYLLTDAERQTETYSNRFAAHILRQHQFHALCAARGWKNKLRLWGQDDAYPPAFRFLLAWNLQAEYWVGWGGMEYGRDTNASGTYLYLTTDQVRFHALDASPSQAHARGGGYRAPWQRGVDTSVPLEAVPPLVFSEIMRDVDLFVGVTSVGNDPNWGADNRFGDYWQRYSFGDLSATAQTRRGLLERLLPRLKIAARCTLSDRFLIVRGDLRTYKIHLGSGNILMAPNDLYLCIVPRPSTAGHQRVFLPFEGDHTLSVILSKALLLADDTKITDPAITSQLIR